MVLCSIERVSNIVNTSKYFFRQMAKKEIFLKLIIQGEIIPSLLSLPIVTQPQGRLHQISRGLMSNQQSSEDSVFFGSLKNGIWLIGTSSWLFGITDRSIASLADGYLSALDLVQLFTASFFFIGWLFLRPVSRA